MGLNALRVIGDIAGHFNFGIEAQDVAVFGSGPDRVAGHDRCSAMMRQFDERRSRAGFRSKKIDKYALVERRVLIDQDADRIASFERTQNFARSVFFFDDVIS